MVYSPPPHILELQIFYAYIIGIGLCAKTMMIGNLAIVKDCNNKEVYFLAHRAARPAASHTMSSTLTLLD